MAHKCDFCNFHQRWCTATEGPEKKRACDEAEKLRKQVHTHFAQHIHPY